MRLLPYLCLLLATALSPPAAALTLHPSLGEHAVLQRDRPVPVFGRDAPGSLVRVTLLDGDRELASAETTTGDDGRFHAKLPPQPAGGPYRVEVRRVPSGGLSEAADGFGDVLFGDVWLASGQSNMQWPVQRSDGAEAVAALATPAIRHLNVERVASPTPLEAPAAAWARTEPANTPSFSAVAHRFARDLHAATGVPIGVVNATWGGTPAAAWTPREALLSSPVTAPLVAADDATGPPEPDAEAAHARALAAWEERYAPGAPESPATPTPATPQAPTPPATPPPASTTPPGRKFRCRTVSRPSPPTLRRSTASPGTAATWSCPTNSAACRSPSASAASMTPTPLTRTASRSAPPPRAPRSPGPSTAPTRCPRTRASTAN